MNDPMDLENQIQKKAKEIYLIQFGNLYLYDKMSKAPKANHCYIVDPWLEVPEETPIDIQLLVKSLKDSSKGTKVSCPDPQKLKWIGNLFFPHIRWHFHPSLKIELTIPFKNQQFAQRQSRDFGVEIEKSNKFTIFYDGSCFMIVTKVSNLKKEHLSSPDVRDFLYKLLEKQFRIETIPPNPLRWKFYLVFLSDSKLFSDTVKMSMKRVYIFIPENRLKEKNEIFSGLFVSSRRFLDVFYSSSMISNSMEHRYVEMFKNHSKIQKQMKTFLIMSNHHVLKRQRIKKALEKAIVKHYEIVLDYDICLNLIEESKKVIVERSKNSIFAKISDELIKNNLKYYPMNFDLHNECLSYVKEILERSFSWKLALYGLFFGGISSFLISYGPQIIDAFKRLVNLV